MRRTLVVLGAVIALTAAACGGPDRPAGEGPATTQAGGGGGGAASGDVAAGLDLYTATCEACHAAGGEGVSGLGKPLKGSDFISGQSEDDLLAFMLVGRDASDPANTTGVAMPPKGGNPALSDDDLVDIIAYLKSLN
jgi:disulfide bond formation protein DsbB